MADDFAPFWQEWSSGFAPQKSLAGIPAYWQISIRILKNPGVPGEQFHLEFTFWIVLG